MTDVTVAFGSFRLNPGRRELTREGERVALGGRALEILCLLAAADGEPVSKSELLVRLWPGAVADQNNLHMHIAALRQQLGQSGRTHLVTVPGFGYRLLASAIPPTGRVGASPERPTLGVLAFQNFSGETRYDVFTAGLTDGVVTQGRDDAAMYNSFQVGQPAYQTVPVRAKGAHGLIAPIEDNAISS